MTDQPEQKIRRYVASVFPARREAVEFLLDQPNDNDTGDGRSEWLWLRLANGDLMLGFWPGGTAYEHVEEIVDDDYGQKEAQLGRTPAIYIDEEDLTVEIHDPRPWMLYLDGVSTGHRFETKPPLTKSGVLEYRFQPRVNGGE